MIFLVACRGRLHLPAARLWCGRCSRAIQNYDPPARLTARRTPDAETNAISKMSNSNFKWGWAVQVFEGFPHCVRVDNFNLPDVIRKLKLCIALALHCTT